MLGGFSSSAMKPRAVICSCVQHRSSIAIDMHSSPGHSGLGCAMCSAVFPAILGKCLHFKGSAVSSACNLPCTALHCMQSRLPADFTCRFSVEETLRQLLRNAEEAITSGIIWCTLSLASVGGSFSFPRKIRSLLIIQVDCLAALSWVRFKFGTAVRALGPTTDAVALYDVTLLQSNAVQ